MSDIFKPTNVYTWPAANATAFCLPQAAVTGTNLILNGALVSVGLPNPIASLLTLGIARVVTITSAGGDNSGSTFTISGTLNGWPVSQTIEGPVASQTDATTQLFETVSQVSVGGTTSGTVSVGTGVTGRTAWFNCDYKAQDQVVTAQVVVNSPTPSWNTAVSLLRVTSPIDPPVQFISQTPLNTNGIMSSANQNIASFAVYIGAGTNAAGSLTAYILGRPSPS